MTLKEELEILRGEPIKVFTDDPMSIPCIETSDPEKLCKHPVVSVSMITYNHEPYIRQAIEGVMMQKTDFEFELIIGEDCSQDKTREICFEYQKKYPDKIRVLWWHENVSKLGGNGRRTRAHCRGEFIALCEGDDYWIDPQKLQKQVDAMRQYPSVGYCVTGARVLCELPRDHPRLRVFKIDKWYDDNTFDFDMGSYRSGLIERDVFWENRKYYPRTATVMYRRSYHRELETKFDIFKWRLPVGDALLWMGFPMVCDAYYLDDVTAIYRINQGGVSVANGLSARNVVLQLIDYYFLRKKGASKDCLKRICQEIVVKRINAYECKSCMFSDVIGEMRKISAVCPEVFENSGVTWKIYFMLRSVGFSITFRSVSRGCYLVRHPLIVLKNRLIKKMVV